MIKTEIEIDRDSPTWRALKAWLEDTQLRYRIELEGLGCDPNRTLINRGRIDIIKTILRLDEYGP